MDQVKLPLNETVLMNVLKNKNISVEDADPDALSMELSSSFGNCDPERIAGLLERMDRPIVFLKNTSAINFDETPSVRYPIEGLLSEGLSLINAPAKGGKSRLMLQMALAICEGASFLGRRCEKSGVLYLALEDQRIDFENRLKAFLGERKAPDNLFYATMEDFNYNTPTLDRGQLIPLLEANLTEHMDVKVILIDVFGVIRSHREKGEQFDMHERRDLQTLLKFICNRPGFAMVIAHHVSKNDKRQGKLLGAIGSGAGSYVVSGSVHTEMLLNKGERDNERVLFAEGRRIPSQKFMLVDDYPRWKYIGSREDYERANNPLYPTIKRILQEEREKGRKSWQGTYAQIEEKNREYSDIPNLTKKLNRSTFTEDAINNLKIIGIAYKQISNGRGVLHQFTDIGS